MSKQFSGVVKRNKMDKTIVVRLERLKYHPLYGKRLRRHKDIFVHDQGNVANVGETVLIQEGKKISKLKSWVLVDSTVNRQDKSENKPVKEKK